jgi:hypothetical protein
MYEQAVGFSPSTRLLGGLTHKGDVGAYAKGQAMASASGLEMDRQQKNQQLGVQAMQQESQQRQQQSQNHAARAGNETQSRIAQGDLANRQQVFNTGMNYDYAALQKRRNLDLQQLLVNHVAREF